MRSSSVWLALVALSLGCGQKADPVQSYDFTGFGDLASLGDVVSGGISYQTLRPILENRCFDCHASTVQGGARQGAPAGVDYDTDESAKANGLSGNAWVQGGGMPPGTPMPLGERSLFKAWIDAGMPENASVAQTGDVSDSGEIPAAGKTTYWTIRPLLQTHCLSCHSSTLVGLARQGAPAGVDYDAYAAAVKYASSGNTWVQSGGMPPVGPLEPVDKALFQSWLESGVPEGTPVDAEGNR